MADNIQKWPIRFEEEKCKSLNVLLILRNFSRLKGLVKDSYYSAISIEVGFNFFFPFLFVNAIINGTLLFVQEWMMQLMISFFSNNNNSNKRPVEFFELMPIRKRQLDRNGADYLILFSSSFVFSFASHQPMKMKMMMVIKTWRRNAFTFPT